MTADLGRTDAPVKRTNRSAEELAMRDRLEEWGRKRWPGCRVVHELVVAECRIDMAFVSTHDLVGVEIKSSKDTLSRIDKQLQAFHGHIPEVWVALAPKWDERSGTDPNRPEGGWPRYRNELVVTPQEVKVDRWRTTKPWRDELVVSKMLDLLWRSEVRAIAGRQSVWPGPSVKNATREKLLPLLARLLTGNEIVAEVCRELRARDAFWKADLPIRTTEGGAE